MKMFWSLTGLLIAGVIEFLLGNCALVVPVLLCAYLQSSRKWHLPEALTGAFVVGLICDLLYLRSGAPTPLIFMAVVWVRYSLPWEDRDKSSALSSALTGLVAGGALSGGRILSNLEQGTWPVHGVEVYLFAIIAGGLLLPFCTAIADLFSLLIERDSAPPRRTPLTPQARKLRQVSSREIYRRGRP